MIGPGCRGRSLLGHVAQQVHIGNFGANNAGVALHFTLNMIYEIVAATWFVVRQENEHLTSTVSA